MVHLQGTPCTGCACAPSVRIRAHQRRGHDCVDRDAMHGLRLCTKRAHSRSSTAWTRLHGQGRHARAALVHQACAFALRRARVCIGIKHVVCCNEKSKLIVYFVSIVHLKTFLYTRNTLHKIKMYLRFTYQFLKKNLFSFYV
jgi:hypothetical protein